MAWETRSRGGRYYTQSKKIKGRVVRRYIGTGEYAELIARLDGMQAARRRRRDAERARLLREAEAETTRIDSDAALLGVLCDALLKRVMMDAGYHQHHRGEWRKRRER